MPFKVIPAVDLKDGRCVQLVQGIPGTEVVSLKDPLGVALRWVEEGAEVLHIIDLDGAIKGNRVNAPLVERIVEECDVEIQVGGGIRSLEDINVLLSLGVDRVILGTLAINSPPLVKDLVEEFGGDIIMVALDAKDGWVTSHGWARKTKNRPSELGKKFESLGAGSLLFTNIDTEGLLRGVNPEPTRELVQSVRIPVIASGGITTLEDIKAIKKTGAVGVVVGTALYLGKFTLKEAKRVADMI